MLISIFWIKRNMNNSRNIMQKSFWLFFFWLSFVDDSLEVKYLFNFLEFEKNGLYLQWKF